MSYTRRTELTCTEAEFSTYGSKVLLANELLSVIKSSGRRDIYYGDGVTLLSGLVPSISYDELNALKNGAAQSAINAKADADRAKDAVKLSVVNDLVSGGIDAPLSAEQGKVLEQTVSEHTTDLEAHAALFNAVYDKMKMVDSRDDTNHAILLSVTADGYPALKIS